MRLRNMIPGFTQAHPNCRMLREAERHFLQQLICRQLNHVTNLLNESHSERHFQHQNPHMHLGLQVMWFLLGGHLDNIKLLSTLSCMNSQALPRSRCQGWRLKVPHGNHLHVPSVFHSYHLAVRSRVRSNLECNG